MAFELLAELTFADRIDITVCGFACATIALVIAWAMNGLSAGRLHRRIDGVDFELEGINRNSLALWDEVQSLQNRINQNRDRDLAVMLRKWWMHEMGHDADEIHAACMEENISVAEEIAECHAVLNIQKRNAEKSSVN